MTPEDQEALAIGRAVFVRRQRAKDEGGDADAIRRSEREAGLAPVPQPAEEEQP